MGSVAVAMDGEGCMRIVAEAATVPLLFEVAVMLAGSAVMAVEGAVKTTLVLVALASEPAPDRLQVTPAPEASWLTVAV